MLNPERKSRSKPSNNFYVPPPARQRQEGADTYVLCDNRAKDRALEAKLKNSAEETKICNNSSLLFKRDEDEASSSGATDPKKKRRRKKKSVQSEPKTDVIADTEASPQTQINTTSESIRVQSKSASPVEYLDEASGYTPFEVPLEYLNDSMIHEVIQHVQEEMPEEEDNLSEDSELKDLNEPPNFHYEPPHYAQIGTEESWDEETVSVLPINKSVDEANQNENNDLDSTDTNESSLNILEENHNTMEVKIDPQSKKSTNTKSLSKGNANKETSDKGSIAKRSVEVCENNTLCANFRSNDVSKINTCKSEEISESVEEEDDFEWEKLLDEDFKNLRVTTTFRTEEENSKAPIKSLLEKEPNDSSIIEIYGFPEEFKTQDLLMSLATFANRGLKLKWVDNTHALGIFPSPAIADEALEAALPFVRTRPLSQATTASKEKAKNIILPPALRPQTCSALARRLVSGALGMRAVFTPAEREAERELLKQAREQKRLAAKQRDAAWEGRF